MPIANVRTLARKVLSYYGVAIAPKRCRRQRTFKPNEVQKVLINVAAPWMGLGDFISATPTVQAIREVAPNSEIYLLVSRNGGQEIIDIFPTSVSVLELPASECERQSGLISFVWRVIRPMHFDLVIHGYLEAWWSVAYINLFGGIPYSIGYSSYAEDRSPNTLNSMSLDYDYSWLVLFAYDERLSKALPFEGTWNASLQVSKKLKEASIELLRNWGIQLGEKVLGIHPGCNKRNEAKKWPVANFIKVAERFCDEYQGKVLVFGGPDEVEEALVIERRLGKERAIAIVGEPLRNIVPLIQHCTAFLSNDSGLMHVALALNVPTVGIFGPVDPTPFQVHYQRVHAVFLQEKVPCGPCFATPGYLACGQIPSPCLQAINADNAYSALVRLTVQRTGSGIDFNPCGAWPQRSIFLGFSQRTDVPKGPTDLGGLGVQVP